MRWKGRYVEDVHKNLFEISEKKTVMMLLKGSLSNSRPPNVRVQEKRVKYLCERGEVFGYKS